MEKTKMEREFDKTERELKREFNKENMEEKEMSKKAKKQQKNIEKREGKKRTMAKHGTRTLALTTFGGPVGLVIAYMISKPEED